MPPGWVDHRGRRNSAGIADGIGDYGARPVRHHLHRPVAPVADDARLLEQPTANLIDNAIRYNIPGGQIHIQVTTSGGQPTLKISNTGPVIPTDQVPRQLPARAARKTAR